MSHMSHVTHEQYVEYDNCKVAALEFTPTNLAIRESQLYTMRIVNIYLHIVP